MSSSSLSRKVSWFTRDVAICMPYTWPCVWKSHRMDRRVSMRAMVFSRLDCRRHCSYSPRNSSSTTRAWWSFSLKFTTCAEINASVATLGMILCVARTISSRPHGCVRSVTVLHELHLATRSRRFTLRSSSPHCGQQSRRLRGTVERALSDTVSNTPTQFFRLMPSITWRRFWRSWSVLRSALLRRNMMGAPPYSERHTASSKGWKRADAEFTTYQMTCTQSFTKSPFCFKKSFVSLMNDSCSPCSSPLESKMTTSRSGSSYLVKCCVTGYPHDTSAKLFPKIAFTRELFPAPVTPEIKTFTFLNFVFSSSKDWRKFFTNSAASISKKFSRSMEREDLLLEADSFGEFPLLRERRLGELIFLSILVRLISPVEW
mmetsp:Transcript_43807/g.110456  ORF Transcript_43807/g.110456 Transcript_43807/m.110456 type:complete len:374 (+) Transcript_43807:634-1755(+)